MNRESTLIGTWKISITWVLCSFLELWRPAVTWYPGFPVSDNEEVVLLTRSVPREAEGFIFPFYLLFWLQQDFFSLAGVWEWGWRTAELAVCSAIFKGIHLVMVQSLMGCRNWRHWHWTGPVYSDREKDMRNRYWQGVEDGHWQKACYQNFYSWKREPTSVGCLFSVLWQSLVKMIICPLKFTLWSLFFNQLFFWIFNLL